MNNDELKQEFEERKSTEKLLFYIMVAGGLLGSLVFYKQDMKIEALRQEIEQHNKPPKLTPKLN